MVTLLICLLLVILALCAVILWQRVVIRVLGTVARAYGASEDDVQRVIILRANNLKDNKTEWQTN